GAFPEVRNRIRPGRRTRDVHTNYQAGARASARIPARARRSPRTAADAVAGSASEMNATNAAGPVAAGESHFAVHRLESSFASGRIRSLLPAEEITLHGHPARSQRNHRF